MTGWALPAVVAILASVATAGSPVPERLVFVVGSDANRIVAIDAGTERAVASFEVPAVPRFAVAAAEGRRLIAVTGNSARLHLFDVPTGRLLRSLDVGFPIVAIKLAENGETIAAAGKGGIAIVDAGAAEVETALPFPATPSALVFDKKGEALLIGDAERPQVHFIDLRDSGARRTLDLMPSGAAGKGVIHLARTPGGSTGLVLHGAGMVALLDLKTRKIAENLVLPGWQEQAFPTINSQYFLIPSFGSRTVSVVSTWTHRESVRLSMKGDVAFLNTLLADTVLFTFDRRAPAVGVFDLDRRRRLPDIALSDKPTATATGPDGLKTYVGLAGRHAVAVIDVRRMAVSGVIENIGIAPAAIVTGGGLSFCH